MGLANAPSTPLTVSAREFDLGRPDVQAPNVQALADAVRQGYIGASEIQQRALAHPTLVAEAEAGPKLVQAKLAAAQAETTPEVLAAKSTMAQAQAKKAQAEAQISEQMAKLGEAGRDQVAYLRSKGVIIQNLDPASVAQQYRDYRDFETNQSIAKANQQRAVKIDWKEVQGNMLKTFTSNGFPVAKEEADQINEAARAGAEWVTLNPDYQTWEAAGKPVFGGKPGTVQTTPPAPSAAPAVSPAVSPAAPATPAATPAPGVASKPPIPQKSGAQSYWDPELQAEVFPKAKERIPGEQVEKAGTAETAVTTALKMNEAYMDLVATRQKMLGPISGRMSKALLAKEWDQKVALFQQAATSLLAPVAKGIFNETGVLSDKDVARYEGVFPSIQDTPDVGLKKLAAITKTILTAYEKKADNWEAFGYDSGPMQATHEAAVQQARDIYQKFGLDFDGAAVEGSIFEAVERGQTRTVNGVTYAAVPGPTGSVVFTPVPSGFAPKNTGAPTTSRQLKPDEKYVFPTHKAAVEGAPKVEPRKTYTPF